MVTAFNPDWSSHVNQQDENSFDIYTNNKANPIRWLEYGYNQLKYGEYFTKETWDKAEAMQMKSMDEFSEWLAKEEYILGHLSSTWRKRVNNSPISMSVLYQMFLKSKEA